MTLDRVRILCIEDNAMNWRLVQRLLGQAGHEMHWAEEGLRGCELALSLRPDLILLDLNLPGLSGFEVATKLRQEPLLQSCLIIALTAKTLKDDRETALVTGCDGFIPKPIDPFQFVAQVEAYLHGRRDRLDPSREGAALRQFSRQVVGHLEGRLLETRQGALQLQAAQAESAQRSHHLSRILALSRRLDALQDPAGTFRATLPELRDLVPFAGIQVYRLHDSGAYFLGESWSDGTWQPLPTLAANHPVPALLNLGGVSGVLHGEALQASSAWFPGLERGLWGPRTHPVLVPLVQRSGGPRLSGFLAVERPESDFSPLELELLGIGGGLLQATLESADLARQLEESSQALGTSYAGLEQTQESLAEARRALAGQDQLASAGKLVDQFAPLLAELAGLACLAPGRLERLEGLVEAVRRRVQPPDLRPPEWLSLHALLRLEISVAQAAEPGPAGLKIEVDLQAEQDGIYGVATDFRDLLAHLLDHARLGEARQVQLRTRNKDGSLVLEVEDDGQAIPPALHALAVLDQPSDPGPSSGPSRCPGPGLAACMQLLASYQGTLDLVPRSQGSLVRVGLPLEDPPAKV